MARQAQTLESKPRARRTAKAVAQTDAVASNGPAAKGQPATKSRATAKGAPAAKTKQAAKTAEVAKDGQGTKKKKKGGKDIARTRRDGKLADAFYLQEMDRLQEELVKLQYWVKDQGLRVSVLFEGRDAAGKGGVIKRILERTNPRVIRVVALNVPTEREKSQWYFQRWTSHLPAGGEVVLFDRSWYTRAITEKVMGFCTEAEYNEFLRSVPEFERMLIRSGSTVLKYWFSVSDQEQERRFQQRSQDPRSRWKLSPMDIESRDKWVEYSRAKDHMMDLTDIKECPWYVVDANDKKRARLNCIAHLLSSIPYQDILPEPIKLPVRADHSGYIRPPIDTQTFVPAAY